MNKNRPERLSQFIIHSPSRTSRVFVASDVMEWNWNFEIGRPKNSSYLLTCLDFLDLIHELIERNIVHQSVVYPLYFKLEVETNAYYVKNFQLGSFQDSLSDEEIRLEMEDYETALRSIDKLAKTVKTMSHPLALIGMNFYLEESEQIPEEIKGVWQKLEYLWRSSMNRNQARVYNIMKGFIKTECDYNHTCLSLFNPPLEIEKVLPRVGLYSSVESVNYVINSLKKNLEFTLEKLKNGKDIRSIRGKHGVSDPTTIRNNLNRVYNEYLEYFIHFPPRAVTGAASKDLSKNKKYVNSQSLARDSPLMNLIRNPYVLFTPFFLVAKEQSTKCLGPVKSLYEDRLTSLTVIRLRDISKHVSEHILIDPIPENVKENILYVQCITSSKFYFASGFMDCPLIPKSGCPVERTKDPTCVLKCFNNDVEKLKQELIWRTINELAFSQLLPLIE